MPDHFPMQVMARASLRKHPFQQGTDIKTSKDWHPLAYESGLLTMYNKHDVFKEIIPIHLLFSKWKSTTFNLWFSAF